MDYADGAAYTGSWENCWRNSFGERTYANGNVHKGTWRDDERYDQSEITFANGTICTVSFIYGEKRGDGHIAQADGGTVDAMYEYGEIVNGTQRRPNGIVYSGAWQNNKAWGYGKLTAQPLLLNQTDGPRMAFGKPIPL